MRVQEPLLSIIVTNYNYDRFLRTAVDSAVAQTYHWTEVIVVDDGSTDASRAILESYAEKVRLVLKTNGGQASAFNAGLVESRGAVIIFLDADDVLLPDTGQRVMEAFRGTPGLAKVHYRLEIIDADGNPTGELTPPAHVPLAHGNLQGRVRAFPDDIPYPPTSGNAFASAVLQRIMPMPEEEYRICADLYLYSLSPLFGPVATLEGYGGYYRVHGGNRHYVLQLDLQQTRNIIRLSCQTHEHLRRVLVRQGVQDFPHDPAMVLSVTFLAHRMVSLRLDGAHHPLPSDTPWKVCRLGIRAAVGRFDVPWSMRAAYCAWFLLMVVVPPPVAAWQAQLLFFPSPQSRVLTLLARIRSRA